MVKPYHAKILQHYQKVAKNFGATRASSLEDPRIRQAETDFFVQEVRLLLKDRPLKILEIGCGNGYLLSVLSEAFPAIELFGIDLTPELVDIVKERGIKAKVVAGDIIDDLPKDWDEFDIIITQRVIINILYKKDQYKALEKIAERLRPGGRYLFSESFKSSLDLLNQARGEMCLEDLKESDHNLYLTDGVFKFLKKIGLEKMEAMIPPNTLSSHFYISRVFHEGVRPKGGKVKHSFFTDFFTEAIPPAIGNFSPIQFYSYRK